MRHVIICQEPLSLAQGCPMVSDHTSALYLVEDRALQRKLAKAGYKVLCGNLRKHRIYERAQIDHDDQVLMQIHDPELAEEVVQQLWEVDRHLPVAVVTANGSVSSLPPPVKHISVASLLAEASRIELRRSRDHQMVQRLRATLSDIKNLLILIQHDPDPDAIASALALRALLGRKKTTTPIGSFGEVKRPENVTMVQLLDVEITKVTAERLRHYDGIALVDVQPPYFKDLLPRVDAVIDHHPYDEAYEAQYRDIRTGFGATSTIFVQYLQAVDAKITRRLATALYYGIKTDTMFLGRETTDEDVEAFAYLYPRANHRLIRRMERPKLPLRDLDAFGYALRARTISDSTFFTHLGIVEREDVLPQFAEFCLQVEGVERSIVSGIFAGNLVVSVRNEMHGKSAGELVRNAFRNLGSAGGHRSMAKAVMPLATLEQEFGRLSDAELGQFVQHHITQCLGAPVAV